MEDCRHLTRRHECGLLRAGIRHAKGIRTTIPTKCGKQVGDLRDRDFTASALNRT